MKKLIVFVITAVVCWQVGAAVGWKNLDKEHHLGGRVTSEGYMRGKVVLVCRWGLKFQKCRTMLPKLEDALRKCISLKQSSDPRVAQEAKNALADIKWALADF